MGARLAFLYAETDTKGAVGLTWGELSKPEQRKAVADVKARLAQAGG